MQTGMAARKKWLALVITEIVIFVTGMGIWLGGELSFREYTGDGLPFFAEGSEGAAPVTGLRRGSYLVTVRYTAAEETKCRVVTETAYGTEYRDTVVLPAETQEKEIELMLCRNAGNFYLSAPGGAVTVESVTIRETNQWKQARGFLLACLIAGLDVLIYLHRRKWWWQLPVSRRWAILGVAVIGSAASAPLFTDYLLHGADLSFHLLRIEGIAQGLREGNFPVKMQSVWINGYGYPVSVMYGDMFLYVPALLRLIGFPLQSVYKMYLFAVNMGTAAVAYHCGKKVSGSVGIGLASSLFYTLSGYRLTNEFYRAALGETTAMLFIPLVLLGLWQLFYRPKEEKSSVRCLMIGYTGILESHLLSFEMMILFSAVYCLLNLKIFWKKLGVLIKTAVLTIGMNLFFLVPMADYMLHEDLHVFRAESVKMQEQALFVPQIFQIFTFQNDTTGLMSPVSYGIGGELLMGAGAVAAALLLLYLGEYFIYRDVLAKRVCRIDWKGPGQMAVLVLLAILLSLCYFPWRKIEMIPVLGKLLAPYQFPMRFSVAALAAGIFLGAFAFGLLKHLCSQASVRMITGAFCMLALLQFAWYSNMLIAQSPSVKVTSAAGIDTRDAVIGGEYMLGDAYAMLANEEDPQTEAGCDIKTYEKEGTTVTFSFKNRLDRDTYIRIPLYAYRGYRAILLETGQDYVIGSGDQHVMLFSVPAKTAGTIRVFFEEPWYWRAAEAVSAAAVLVSAAGLGGGSTIAAGIRRRCSLPFFGRPC